jgi:hypothetical protein
MSGPPIVAVPAPLPEVLDRLASALGGPVVVVGGWAVHCRLRMGRSDTRPTEDLDVIVGWHLRPAAAALGALHAVQDDPEHPCRLTGLPLLVDLLADDDPPVVAAYQPDRLVEDADGLRLLKPLQGGLLTRTAEPALLADPDGRTAEVLLPRAGPLFAAKMANLTLEGRGPKLESDGEDVAMLIRVFGAAAVLDDLNSATSDEANALLGALTVVRPSAVHNLSGVRSPGLARLSGAFDVLIDALREEVS